MILMKQKRTPVIEQHIEPTQWIYFMSVGSMWVWASVLTNCTLSFEGNLLEPQWEI